MRKTISAIAIGLSLITPSTLPAADVAEEGKTLIRKMHAARQQLNSGIVHLRGIRESYNPEDPERCYQYQVDADLAFDWPAGCLRYDARTVEDAYSYNAEEFEGVSDVSEVLDARDPDAVTARMWSVLTPETYVWYMNESTPERPYFAASTVCMFHSDTDAAAGVVQMFYCFDVRAVGLFNYWEFIGSTHLMGYELPESHFHLCDLDIAIEELLKWPVIAIERDGELTTIRFRGDMTITLNESQGFTPVEYYDVRGQPRPNYINETVASSVHWEQIDDVWVPTHFMIEMLDNYGKDTALRHTYTLEWSHVNQPIPEHYFDFRSFPDVEDDTIVFDCRNDDTIQIGTWSDGQFVPEEPPGYTTPPALKEAPDRSWTGLLLLNTAVFVLILAGTLVYRLFRRQAV